MKLFISFLFHAFVGAAALAGLRGIPDPPNPQDVKLADFRFSGPGCPQQSASASISPDGTTITIGFDGYQTYLGPGTTVSDSTKNCALRLALQYPSGYQFSVIDTTYHGYAKLDTGINCTFYSTYYITDLEAASSTRATITGGGVWAQGQVYTMTDSFPTDSYFYSHCNGASALNVNNRIALRGSTTNAVASINDDGAAFTLQFRLAWRTCRN